eukprot:gene12117-12256_t
MILGGTHSTPVTAESQKIAEVAVQQLNGKANFPKKGTLKLDKVVAGINHYLTIETHDDAGKHTVEVQVWEKLPSNVKANELPVELTNFKIVEGHQQVKITGDVQL